MLGLIDIQYGFDPSGNPLSFALNPTHVGSVYTGPTGFYIFLNAVNAAIPINDKNYSTKIFFNSPNSNVAQSMENEWISATNSLIVEPQIVKLNFSSQGCTFAQTIVSSP